MIKTIGDTTFLILRNGDLWINLDSISYVKFQSGKARIITMDGGFTLIEPEELKEALEAYQ